MKEFFDLPHIFIVFHAGSAGNFVANTISELINSSLTLTGVTDSGSAHNSIEKKVKGVDYLSFGTEFREQLYFKDNNDRIDFYIKKIKEEYKNVNKPQVIWSHDFTNIPIYKKLFPKSKILVITQNTPKEKLIITIMHVIKTLFDEQYIIPTTPARWTEVIETWKFFCRIKLRELIKLDNVDFLLDNKFDPKYKDLLLYATISSTLKYFKQEGFLTNIHSLSQDISNIVLFPTPIEEVYKQTVIVPYKLGLPYKFYITNDCITLPYEFIVNDNVDIFLDCLTSVIGQELHHDQRSFVINNFNNYRNKQNSILLSDPVLFYKNLESNANKIIATLVK